MKNIYLIIFIKDLLTDALRFFQLYIIQKKIKKFISFNEITYKKVQVKVQVKKENLEMFMDQILILHNFSLLYVQL